MSYKIDWTTIDTGWVNCTYVSGVAESDRSWGGPIQCRRVGKKVSVRGQFRVTDSSFTSDQFTIAQVPSQFIPNKLQQGIGQGEYNTYFRSEIRANGEIAVGHKIGISGTAVNAPIIRKPQWNETWYSIDGLEYFVD